MTRHTAPRIPLAVRAWLRLARVFHKVSQASLASMRRRRISIGQFDVIATVGAAEGATQQEVADALLVTKSNVCQLLDRMERAGLVSRKPEGRSNRLYLTEDGRALHDCAIPAHERQIAELFSALSSEELVQLLGLLRKLDHALD